MRPLTPSVGLPALAHIDLAREIARVLTYAVVQGRIAPGGRLVEAAVARERGVSRAPVRKAARRLDAWQQVGALVRAMPAATLGATP